MKLIKYSLCLVVLTIIFFSLKPNLSLSDLNLKIKSGHFLAYFVLTLNTGLLFSKRQVIYVVIASFCFGLLLEFFQYFIPGRTVDLNDIISNGLGSTLGGIIIFIYQERLIKLLMLFKIIKSENYK